MDHRKSRDRAVAVRTRMLGALALGLFLGGCLGMPEGVKPVTGFELDRYLGQWHEIARLDHSFERGLEQVTADYRLRDDGAVEVINRGLDAETGEWQQAEGVAQFVGPASEAHLKVSFFGPFYGSYVVFSLGEDYDYAFVSGYNRDYLWLLARTPSVPDALKEQFVGQAKALGFDADALIWVDQSEGEAGEE